MRLLAQSLKFILNGEPIISPTDTVYGLVCRYNSKKAIEKIYKLKKRSRRKPLILLGHNWNALKKFVRVESLHARTLRQLIKKNWPGPLTIVLPASKNVPAFLNKGFKTIGIRVPKNKFLLQLLGRCPEKVLASTSANISGESDKKPQRELEKKIKLFIKAKKGEMSFKSSRIIEISKKGIQILR